MGTGPCPPGDAPVRRHGGRPRPAIAVGAVAILLAAFGMAAPVDHPHHDAAAGALGSLTGVVAAQSPTGAITWVDPIGGGSLQPAPLQGLGALDPVAVASDDSVVLDSSGSLLTIGAGRVAATSTPLTELRSDWATPSSGSVFADGNRAVLLLTRARGPADAATLVSLAGGRRSYLGVVDSAGGDPQSLGAFVSEPYGRGWPPAPDAFDGDSGVELISVGGRPTVLATTDQLERDIGWPPGTPVRIGVFPNSLGDAIAVVLDPVRPRPGNLPMVILTRQGALLAAMTDQTGPSPGSRPQWSPGGHQITYTASTQAGPAVVISTETGAAETYPAPAGTTFGACIWSPASTDVLCQSQELGEARWVYATTSATQLVTAPSFGRPLIWLGVLPEA